ncbi:hypothetical protein EJB05_37080, partial [Eragrostis curvula]
MQKVARLAGGDRLSTLPEDLLHAILSLLPAWEAVQTCVLAKRWRDIWRSMPCLHLDEPLHLEERRHGRIVPVFEDFASNLLLLLHNAPALDSFRLVVTSPSDRALQRWIRYAVMRRPAVLEIQNRHPWLQTHQLVLPAMDYSRYFAGRLRRMRLCGVRIDGRFFRGVMEDLELERCSVENPKITLQTVKNLTIRDCENDLLVITAPALVSLSCQGRNTISLRQTAASRVKAPICYRFINRLRKLRLRDVRLDGRFAASLQSSCPVLEDLELRLCQIEFSKIALPAVTHLTIYFCENDLLVVAPALMFLSCHDNTILLQATAASLVKAYISLPAASAKTDIQRELLASLFNVTSLYLSDFDTMAMFVDEPAYGFPVFRNLKNLSIERCFSDWSDWTGKFTALGSFVQNAPNLKKLSLCNCAFSEWEENKIYETSTAAAQNQELSPFHCENLETVEIKYYYGGDLRMADVLEGIRRTLGKPIVLTKMPINYIDMN